MRCPRCAAQVRESARFCEDCGASLRPSCPRCGAEAGPGKKFCGECGAALVEASESDPSPATRSPDSAFREERRWATVLFADLTGFTALSERMDPEDVKAMAHRCAEQMGEEIHRFGGTVIDVMGDAVMAVFGAPSAHEDDPERAVRAGLAIRDCNLTDADGDPLRVHVGINTGEVMAGQIGPEQRRQYSVLGDTVNTAARLMSAAPAGSVFVGQETYRATRRLVRYGELPAIDAKGKAQPVAVWEALEVAPISEARPLGTAPLVGRDDALALLGGTWSQVARESRPHLVSILGEPGIGKSRLVAEFERQALGAALVLHGRCLSYGEALGYWALAAALKEAAAITGEQDAAAARAQLGDLVFVTLGADEAPDEVARHLALLCGLDNEADRAGPSVDQRRLHGSVRRFLEALARQRPLCLILEDLHWADGALLDLVEFVASRAQDSPIMIVTLARPELIEERPAWGGGVRAFTSLPLQALGEDDGRALIAALCREHGLSDVLSEQVGRGAGGNPLFAEELVAMIAERGASAGVPSAIKALISARLDALPPEQRLVLQRAAVIGKHFWSGGLRALGVGGDVDDHLETLEQKDFLRALPRSWFRGDREYSFKHDLIRDVAYETLPRSERRVLHGRVADWMELAAGERVGERLDVLAYHAAQAEQHDRAIEYLIRASAHARRAAAHREEAALLGQALAIAERAARTELLADLLSRRGKAYSSLTLWADAQSDLDAALARLTPEQGEQRAEVLINLALVRFWSFDAAGFRRHAAEALPLAEAAGRDDLVTEAMAWLAAAEGSDGRLESAVTQYRRTIARAGDLRMPSPALTVYQSTLYWIGAFDDGIEHGREALRVARAANNIDLAVQVLQGLGLALAGSGRYDEAAQTFDEAIQLGREYGLGPFLARSLAVSTGFRLDTMDLVGHERAAEEAREQCRASGFQPGFVSASIDLLLNFARRGEVGRAEPMLPDVAAAVEKAAGWHGWQWSLRLAEARAEIALARGDWEEAMSLAARAVELSRGKRAKYEVLGLGTRAQALNRLGRGKDAVVDLRRAVELARVLGDPAVFLRAATMLLALDGDDELAAEAHATAERIAQALPDAEMRRCFEAAEPLRILAGLSA